MTSHFKNALGTGIAPKIQQFPTATNTESKTCDAESEVDDSESEMGESQTLKQVLEAEEVKTSAEVFD